MKRIAVLGYGSIGQRHVSTLRENFPTAQLLVHSSQKIASDEFLVTGSLADVREFRPDFAIICGPPASRLEAIEALPNQIRGILIEKPLALDYRQAREAKIMLRDKGVFAQVGYNLRFSPSLVAFKKKVDEQGLGRLLGVRAESGQNLASWRPGRMYQDTVSASNELGGGVLRELSHEIDYLGWIFGRVSWVSAWLGRQSSLEIDVEDTAHITMGLASRGIASAPVAQLNLDFVRHDRTRTVQAIFERGTLRWNGNAGTVEQWLKRSSGWEVLFVEEAAAASTYLLQWEAFVGAAKTGHGPGATVDDGVEVLAVIDSIRLSDSGGGQRSSPKTVKIVI